MNKNGLFLVSLATAAVLTSCSGKLGALSSDNFSVTPNPLESQAGQVSATINGMFPEKYMKKKAVVTVTPQLRFQGEQGQRSVNGESATFQGEKVLGNDQTISYMLGGHYTMKTTFPYNDAMRESDLYLTFDAKIGKKQVQVPAVKVADGVIATSELYHQTLLQSKGCLAQDAFQRVVAQKQNANIRFLIQPVELRLQSIKLFLIVACFFQCRIDLFLFFLLVEPGKHGIDGIMNPFQQILRLSIVKLITTFAFFLRSLFFCNNRKNLINR